MDSIPYINFPKKGEILVGYNKIANLDDKSFKIYIYKQHNSGVCWLFIWHLNVIVSRCSASPAIEASDT